MRGVFERRLGNGGDQILSYSGGTWYVYSWNGSSFTATSTGISTSSMWDNVVAADLNGDGLDDLFCTTGITPVAIAFSWYQWEQIDVAIRYNTTTGGSLSFGSAAIGNISSYGSPYTPTSLAPGWTSFYAGIPQYTAWKGGDRNGDGIEEIAIQMVVSWCAYPTYECGGWVDHRSWDGSGGYAYDPSFNPVAAVSTPIDFNGDGCSDYVVYDTADTIGISDCTTVVASEFTAAVPISATPWGKPAVLDWDGDGRKDFIYPNLTTGYYEITPFYGTTTGSPISTGIPYSGYCNFFVTDGNGDQLDDFGCEDGYGITIYPHNGVNLAADLAVEFKDGYGVTHTPSYTAIARGNYTGYRNAPDKYRDIRRDRLVVSQVVSTDGTGGTYTTAYEYFGGLFSLQGRGFSGFDKIESVDSRNGVKQVRKFKREFPYSGMIYEEASYQPGSGPLMRRATMTASSITLDPSPSNERYFPYVSVTTKDEYEVGGTRDSDWITSTTVSNTYDNDGNLTASTSVVTDKDSSSGLYGEYWTTAAATTFDAYASNRTTYWCRGLPTAMAVTQSSSVAGETSVYQSKGYSPDYVNCRQDAETVGSGALQVDTSYGYDAFGNVNSVSVTGRNPDGSTMTARTTGFGFGTTGQFPLTETNAYSQTTTRTFDPAFGSVATEVDPNGITVVSRTFDGFGRPYVETLADGTYKQFIYYPYASGLDPRTRERTGVYSYALGGAAIRQDHFYRDMFGRAIIEYRLSASGSSYDTATRGFDSSGRLSWEGAPFSGSGGGQYTPAFVTSYSYDLLGRVVTQSRPEHDGSSPATVTTGFAYEGRTQKVTDPHSKLTTRILDVNGRMRQSKDHNNYYQNFAYDAAGNLTAVTDSASTLFTATLTYGGIKPFQTATTDMDLGTWGYTYNSLGELVEWTDANNPSVSNTFSQTYDLLSRVTSRTEPEGTTTWTWGTSSGSKNIGRLAGVSMTGYSENLYYDSIGRPVTRSITTDQGYDFDTAYNNQGLIDTLTYPTSTSSTRVKVKYGYAYGVLQSVTDWTSGSAATVYWTADSQNARGQTTQETLGNGVVTTRDFDAVTGWLKNIRSGPNTSTHTLQNLSYSYDFVGNVTLRQEGTQGLIESFYYDNLYRLDYSTLKIGSGSPATNLTLTYDAMGNITNRSDVNGNATWTYHSVKKHAVATTGSGGTSYSYDANGNMISRGGAGITWASYNYPTQLIQGSETADFSYGPDRQYYKQVYTGPGGSETTYYAGGLLEKVCAGTSCGGGAIDWRHYIVAEGQTVAIVSRSSSGNAVYYPLEDNQGSGATLTDSSGTNLVRQSYNAFGLPRDGADWDGAVPSGDKTVINGISRRGYTSHSMLGDMGLIHMNGRVQDAITGRFLSPDPTIPDPGFTQSYNRYAYVNNNPLSFVDPSGFAPSDPFIDAACQSGLTITGKEISREWCAGFYTFTEMSENGMLLPFVMNRQEWAGCPMIVLDCNTYHDQRIQQQRADRKVPTIEFGELESEPPQGGSTLDRIQTALDAGGFLGPVGPFADGANALVSAFRGNWMDAGISVVAMLPLLGDGVKGAKMAGEALQHTPDQRAIRELADDLSMGGRKPISRSDADTLMEWAGEYNYPGARATAGDLASPSNWTANPVPHIHLPGAGRGGHIPVGP